MKFSVIKTSDYPQIATKIELNSLEEFLEWCKSTGEEVIVCKNGDLEVYDDDRE